MRDIFYSLITISIITFLFGLGSYYDDNPRQRTEELFDNTIVIDKTSDFISKRMIFYDYKNDTIIEYRVYGGIYNKYETGDTTKFIK